MEDYQDSQSQNKDALVDNSALDNSDVTTPADVDNLQDTVLATRVSAEELLTEKPSTFTAPASVDATTDKDIAVDEGLEHDLKSIGKDLSVPDTPMDTAEGNDDDDFGDFGTFGTTIEASASGDTGDDDGFGDFGEVQAAGGSEGDDDFGDFNEFADGDGFQNAGDDFGDFEGAGDDIDAFDAPAVSSAPGPSPSTIEEAPSVETAPDFTAVNSRQVESYVIEKLSALYPIDNENGSVTSPVMLNTDMDDMDMATVLSNQELWTSLCEQSFQGGNNRSSSHHQHSGSTLSGSSISSAAPQFQWKLSDLRKEYYASLGLVVVKEQQSIITSSIPSSLSSPASSSRSRISSPMIVSTGTMQERKPLDIAATQAFCQFTPENLGGYSGDEMKDIIAQLTELTRQASDELTYWLDQREQMIMDSERYNEMIASLVGRAAKLKDAESKLNTKTKRLTRTSFNLK
ncbi:hypothetical protein EDD11_008384 [Mortierella claussenii]|nr:hypothetical protein EDD11_008384 [Mortierella claussenii]